MNPCDPNTLIEKVKALPAERLAEVEDFVDFLRMRLDDSALVTAAAKRSERHLRGSGTTWTTAPTTACRPRLRSANESLTGCGKPRRAGELGRSPHRGRPVGQDRIATGAEAYQEWSLRDRHEKPRRGSARDRHPPERLRKRIQDLRSRRERGLLPHTLAHSAKVRFGGDDHAGARVELVEQKCPRVESQWQGRDPPFRV